MQTVFIRHNLDSKRETLEELWSQRLIAIHYESIPSVDPEDYKSDGKAALKRLWNYCKSGAVVGATYRSIRPNKILVGEIEQGSKVEILRYSKHPDYNDYIYKVVRLKNAREILYLDYPLLAAIQPRLGTIMGWPSAEKYLLAILKKQKIERSVDSLDPSQLEVLCYEFLRMNGSLTMLFLPIGRSLLDIDICGIDKYGNKVLAQVTHSKNIAKVNDKLNRLKQYKTKNAKLIFFGQDGCKIDDPKVHYITIQQVFSTLNAKPMYRQLITTMLK